MALDDRRREFLYNLLRTASPSGFETAAQRVWTEYVQEFADEVETDAYGNAVAVYEGSGEGNIAFGGHADEIGFMIREIGEDGFLSLTRIGGSDRTVSRGQHVTVHGEEPVHGVIGQTAIHLRENGEDTVDDISEMRVDIGVDSAEAAEGLVEVGDPITFATELYEMEGTRLTGRGMDNRIGIWAAAEGLRRAAEAGTEATVYAVATVQEEVGLNGARMIGFDLDPDAFVAVDVTHATDSPDVPAKRHTGVKMGGGPVVARGSTNHPRLVDRAREAADGAGIDIQLQAAGSRTGTDADAVFTSRSGIPSLNIGLPNRYMHTPVEVIDTDDLEAIADLLGVVGERAHEYDLHVEL